MSSIYKYIPEQYVEGFVRRGELLFRSLSYFRDYEEQQVRGDKYEGTRLHQKKEGLVLTMVESGETRIFNGSLESKAQAEDIFVMCLSTELSAQLARDFKANVCIEIYDPIWLLTGLRSALRRRPSIKNKTLFHAPVTYYDPSDDVGIEWAFPSRIGMSKTRHYERQSEYRIAFGLNGALAFQNTSIQLVSHDYQRGRPTGNHREMLLKVGSLKRYCTVWKFGPDGTPVKQR